MKKERVKAMVLMIFSATTLLLSGCNKTESTETLGSLEAMETDEYGNVIDWTDAIEGDGEDYETDEYGNIIESDEETTEAPLVEETTREASESLPDVAIYDDTVLENYILEINNSERYTINYPKDYAVENMDKYKTFLIQENTQIFVYCINEKFDKSNEVYYSPQVQDELYRFPYKLDGVGYTASIMDRKAVTNLNVKDKKVARETPSIEFASNDKRNFVKPTVVSYFTTFDNRGFALIAVSTDKEVKELDIILTDMVSTLGTYVPSNKEAEYEFNGNIFVTKDKTGISFPYPTGWKITYPGNGFVVISAPQDGTLFEGAKIIYRSDSTGEYVTDYAQYAGIPDDIAYIYMTSHDYDEEKMKSDFMVMSMDDKVTLDGVPCYLFQIEDYMKPQNKAAELLLPSTGPKVYSYRYTFESNGIPAMVSFHYTAKNQYQVRDMADNIMSKITLK